MSDWELHTQSSQQSLSDVAFSMDAQMGPSIVYNPSFQSHGDGTFDVETSLFEDFTSTSSFPIVDDRIYQESKTYDVVNSPSPSRTLILSHRSWQLLSLKRWAWTRAVKYFRPFSPYRRPEQHSVYSPAGCSIWC